MPVSQTWISFVVPVDITPRFIDFFSLAGPKIKFSAQSPDNLHWLIVAIDSVVSPIR